MEWIEFSDKMPTLDAGKQVDIFFYAFGWATFMRGMYTHYPEYPLRERLSEYNPERDKFHAWESSMPTHWMKCPDLPDNQD